MIDHDNFVQWALDNFDDVKVDKDEVKIPDRWWPEDDHGHHCWCNTSKNCFRAFKSENSGTLIELIMEVEGCTWKEAYDILGGDGSLHRLEEKLEDFLRTGIHEEEEVEEKAEGYLALPDGTFLIKALMEKNPIRVRAERYLRSRKINLGNLMICTQGRFRDRIVIPYYDKNGDLVFFNARHLDNKVKPKYCVPNHEECGVGKADVVWMGFWPQKNSKVYITEGEFDAMSLVQCGYNAGAVGGKSMSNQQIELLRPYRLTMAFDSDKAGKDGLKIANELLGKGFREVSFVRPPEGYKDWNTLLVETHEDIVKYYIDHNERVFDPYETMNRLGFQV